MLYKVIKCPECGWIQVTRAKRPKCMRCGYHGKDFTVYAEFHEGWKATAFIQKLKERLERGKGGWLDK